MLSDLYKRANISKTIIRLTILQPLNESQTRNTLPLKKSTILQNFTHFSFQVSYLL